MFEPRKGVLSRFLRRSHTTTITKRTEQLNLKVPADKAEAVLVAVERWLRAHDVNASVSAEDAGNGKTRINAKLDETDAAKINFSDENVQSDLQNVLADAMS